jgi:DNA-binding NarL/FixJ family response regulator
MTTTSSDGGLKALLQENAGWEICGEALSGRQAVDLAREMQPDIAIVDLMMPDLNGLEATRQIRKASERTQVLIFTMHHSESLIHDVLEAGARGYLLKTDAERHIVNAVETLLRRQPYFSTRRLPVLPPFLPLADAGLGVSGGWETGHRPHRLG